MFNLKKILVVISNTEFGGAQRVAFELVDYFNHNGIEAKLVAISESKKSYAIPHGMDLINCFHTGNSQILRTICRLRKIVKHESPDAVISMGVPLSLFTVPALLFMNTIHIISERNNPKHFLGKSHNFLKILTFSHLYQSESIVRKWKSKQLFEERDFYLKKIIN